MDPEFRSIDIDTLDLSELPRIHLTRVDLPFNTSIPFAIVHYERKGRASSLPPTLRLDLGKRVFLDNVVDPALQEVAARLSGYLGAVRQEAPKRAAVREELSAAVGAA